MENLPLHPAIVHLPIGIGMILPILTIAVLLGIYRKQFQTQTWLLVVLMQLLYCGSVFMASQTGEQEEDRVEEVVAEAWIEMHEEATEPLLPVGGVVLILTCLALVKNSKIRKTAQSFSVVGMLLTCYLLYNAGHTGGELVYLQGATKAYQQLSLDVPITSDNDKDD